LKHDRLFGRDVDNDHWEFNALRLMDTDGIGECDITEVGVIQFYRFAIKFYGEGSVVIIEMKNGTEVAVKDIFRNNCAIGSLSRRGGIGSRGFVFPILSTYFGVFR
jgi:hypothetical protein